jgi:peptidoglycan hydrolase-like protein with peptidoglycan-binding domain
MHFEVSDEKIRHWHATGKFDNAPVPQPECVLSIGDRGDEVIKLQERLNELGAGLDVDGIFGRNTLAAVMAFQASKGLEVDGIVGRLTWEALRRA